MNKNKIQRIILFGGSRNILYCAKSAIKKGFEVILFTDTFRLATVINEKGTLKQNLKKEGIDYNETDNLSKELISPYVNKNTLGISIVTFWIFTPEIIELFQGRLYNFHGARLPSERGGGTYTWKILSKIRLGGLTIHKVAPRIDAGEIVMFSEFMYPPSCRIPQDYINYIEEYEKELLSRFLDAIQNASKLKPIPQIETCSLYWPLLHTELNGYINWDWHVSDIELFINAFDDPYAGASTFYQGKKVRLKKCFLNGNEGHFHPFQSGIVFRISNEYIFIAAVDGTIVVREVLDENGNSINNNIKIGHRFYTPYKALENAKKNKAVYGSTGIKYPR